MNETIGVLIAKQEYVISEYIARNIDEAQLEAELRLIYFNASRL